MSNLLREVPVYFYLPKEIWPNDKHSFPKKIEHIGPYLQSICEGPHVTIYSWVLQTYLWLQAYSRKCTLVGDLPSEGIVFTYWQSIPIDFKPSSKLLIISILADGLYPHPYTQLRIVQNHLQASVFHNSYFMPHWPQPNIIQRSSDRKDLFKNVGYFGSAYNLAAEIKSYWWQEQLQSLGLNLCVVESDDWHNYSNIDVILAVRSFDDCNYITKPATKLYNAWHAGVPAILGRESAYQAERKSNLDYLEVSSANEILAALKHLSHSKELRQAMIDNGHCRAKETNIEIISSKWHNFITQVAIPAYEEWCSATYLFQQSLFAKRYIVKKINGLSHRMAKTLASN